MHLTGVVTDARVRVRCSVVKELIKALIDVSPGGGRHCCGDGSYGA